MSIGNHVCNKEIWRWGWKNWICIKDLYERHVKLGCFYLLTKYLYLFIFIFGLETNLKQIHVGPFLWYPDVSYRIPWTRTLRQKSVSVPTLYYVKGQDIFFVPLALCEPIINKKNHQTQDVNRLNQSKL